MFFFSGVAPGQYSLAAYRDGFIGGRYGAEQSGGPGTVVSISQSQTVTGFVLRLIPQGVITGAVLDDNSRALSNIEVRAIRTRWIGGRPELAIISSSVTDTVGRYTLQGLSEGLYYVAAHVPCTLTERTKNGEGTVCWEYSPNSSNAASAVVIAVTAGLAIAGVDIRMRALEVFRLHGQVLNYVGTSGPLTIELRPKDDSTGASSLGALAVRTGKEGTFTFDGVAAGLYELGVRGEVKASNLNSEPHLLTTTEINVVHDIDDLKVYAFPLSDVAGQIGD